MTTFIIHKHPTRKVQPFHWKAKTKGKIKCSSETMVKSMACLASIRHLIKDIHNGNFKIINHKGQEII